MAINKVVYDGSTLIDLTDTTAVASDVAQGKYFYDKTGNKVEGTASAAGAIVVTEEVLPGGGVAKHISAVDISDTTAQAADVAQGKYFYTAQGVKTAGTASGGGGLEYEEGTWSPSEDIADARISFAKTHSSRPAFVILGDTSAEDIETYYSASVMIGNFYDSMSMTPLNKYGMAQYFYTTSSTSSSGGYAQFTTLAVLETWLTSSDFRAYTGSTIRYWKAGRTYKWIAVWAPTT